MKRLQEKLQSFAGAMMVPIILFVLVGFYVGIGFAFMNYILPNVLPDTTFIGLFVKSIFNMLAGMGFLFMNYLPIWFSVGIAFTLAKKEKGWAAFAGLIMFFVYINSVGKYANVMGWNSDTVTVAALMAKGYSAEAAMNFSAMWGSVAGIFTFDMGIFSGILSGIVAALIHNKFCQKEFPAMFAFFAGPKYVIILITLAAMPMAIATFYVWPVFAGALQAITKFIGESGLLGTFVFGTLDKMLLPFGIHHLIAFPIEYSRVGGTMMIDGVLYEGVRNIITGQAASATATGYITRNFTTGRVLFQLAGLPGAATAMWYTAKKENRKKVASIVIPAVITIMLVGISEPIEYTFLFVAPALYWLVYAPLSGLMYVLAEVAKISINGHALFFMIPNLFQPQKVHAMALIWLLPLAFFLYFFIFKFLIEKFNLKTPGRGEEEVAFMSKKKYKELKNADGTDTLETRIVEALGGPENIETLSACATRLRVAVKDETLVAADEAWKQHLEAMGVVRSGKSLQIIYGVRVTTLLTKIKDILNLD